jgi:class 3 adenylate cyclase
LALLPTVSAAVDAGVAIRAQLADQRLSVRIGIHVGEVDTRGDDVSGMAVNVTARIMAGADAGQILMSDIAARLTEAHTELVGERDLKGVDGPWSPYLVV